MEDNLKKIIEQFVDLLMPELTPYEAVLWLFLFRNSHIKNNILEIRIGKRTIVTNYAKGSRGEKTNYEHISQLLKRLEEKGCLKIGNTNREGTLYVVLLPENILVVAEKLGGKKSIKEEDYFTDEKKRAEIFERDQWLCFYCGEKVGPKNATLDHLIPQCKEGKHTRENLKTSCLICNSIKSGKTYDEAAPLLLKNIQKGRLKTAK